jgi:hypothetical protein
MKVSANNLCLDIYSKRRRALEMTDFLLDVIAVRISQLMLVDYMLNPVFFDTKYHAAQWASTGAYPQR